MTQVLGMTQSVCAECRRTVPAKLVTDGRTVHMRKHCPEHGGSDCVIENDLGHYLRALRYVKPAWIPRQFGGDCAAPCPEGCGFCERHEQHLCLPIVEVTQRCDLDCPVCLVDAGRGPDMEMEQFRALLDTLETAEGRLNVLNLSGGEPLLHPDLPALIDEANSRPAVVRVSVSTNGLRFLADPGLLEALAQRDVIVSLQFDGFTEAACVALRGRPLLAEKLAVLDLLAEAGVSTSLTMTVAAGVNDDQIRPMLDYVFRHEHVVSLMVQPLAFAGRASPRAADAERLTMGDAVRALGEAGHPAVRAGDFVPLPCSHPLCFSLAFFIVPDDGPPVSVARLIDAGDLLDALSNQVFFGLAADDRGRLRDLTYKLWSGPAAAAPDAAPVLGTVRAILREASAAPFDPRRAFAAAERRIKSIFLHAFQDAGSFDLARVRRCCNAYPQPDGRLVPACVHNVMGRRR